MYFIAFCCFVAGIIYGTQMSLLWQGGAIVVAILALNIQPWFKEMEILIPYIWLIAFVVGLIVGDISYLLQTDFEAINNVDITNPFKVPEGG